MGNSINILILAGGILIICSIAIWRIAPSNDGKLDDILREIHQIKIVQLPPPENKIGKRLEEANENWKRGLQARKTLESQKLVDSANIWSYKNGISIWDFFYPNFNCPHTVERIGKSGDGGKWVCGLSHLAKKLEPCVVYSYGINTDSSFEAEIVARTNCSVYMFDHTIDINTIGLPKLHSDRVFIEKVGLGVTDSATLRSILSTMKKYGHNFIDIIKIDVEGAEFPVFDNFKNDFPDVLPFGQVSIEIHFNEQANNIYFEKYKSWLTNLEDMGLRAFRNEFNLIALTRTKTHYPTLCEYSFINVKNSNNYLLHE